MGLFGEFWMFNLLVLFMSIFGLIVWLLKRQYTYWERKGIKSYPNPRLLVGHFGPAFAQKEFIGELIARLYKNSKEPFVGIYGFLWPFLLVRDPELIRSILIKDFPSFTDRMYSSFHSVAHIMTRSRNCFCTLIRWCLFRRSE